MAQDNMPLWVRLSGIPEDDMPKLKAALPEWTEERDLDRDWRYLHIDADLYSCWQLDEVKDICESRGFLIVHHSAQRTAVRQPVDTRRRANPDDTCVNLVHSEAMRYQNLDPKRPRLL